MMKQLSGVPPVLAMRNVFLVGSVPLVLLALLLDKPWQLGLAWESASALIALGIFCGGIAYVMFIIMVQRSGPTFTSLVGYLVTLVGVATVASGGELARLASLAINPGDLLMLLACLLYAGYTVGLRRRPF